MYLRFKFMPSLAFIFLIVVILPDTAMAFGKKRPTNNKPQSPYTQAFPTRDVGVGAFYDTPFMLPNGQKIDMSIVLPSVAVTELGVGSGGKIRALAPGAPTSRYVLRGGITSFEALVNQYGIRFGWKPGGDVLNGFLTGAEGSLKVTVKDLGMDFFIEDIQTHRAIAATSLNANATDINLEVNVDFKAFETGADYIHNDPLGRIFREMIRKIVGQMVGRSDFNQQIQWEGKVLSLNDQDYRLRSFLMGAGFLDGIRAWNMFTVYEGSRRLGEVYADPQGVENNQTTMKFIDDPNDTKLRALREGDVLRICYLNSTMCSNYGPPK